MGRLSQPNAGAVILALAVLAFVVVAVTAPIGAVLVVENAETGERYVAEPVNDGSTVALEYTHSVEKSRVYDEYRVDGRTLVNTRMEFESYGWGLPARVNVTTVNGTFVYDPAEPITELDELFVSPGRIANHTLIVDERQYDFVAVTEGNDVRVHIERRSLLERIL
ncbi:DUF1850 domain-containing protein [Halorubrum lacusprofundi]|jgi:hypothetical protein|uniref:TRAP-type transport system protein n=1 Tax=Halorubrum lacusprofundi (strain ATCC 49239 / DSM 5036 / JCM 8891 / ACAM 34) TaxID=416348 RepID=B9LSF7_HALLT|nr:DUF1850 domain-containing protein [Halorubrum lacusprofundi]ACM57904.1 Domain of unknown function DUF1850 [Halorubrum lacusprofundi ATCC 49239]MCG1006942.1 DUF1850 domain-containing protein [Halorubrum lacusprofundi]